MGVLPLLLLLGSLFSNQHVGASSALDVLKLDALKWEGSLTCDQWDCNCPFFQQRGCCCAAPELHQIEDDTFKRMMALGQNIKSLGTRVKALTDGLQIAFKATMNPLLAVALPGSSERCFGPFNTNVPIPYSTVSLNTGNGYNPSLGVFTAPVPGVYMFSVTVYSAVEPNGRLYHKVQMMKNGLVGVGVWENNREDIEDSATLVVTLEMKRGDQVHLELTSGRKLCTALEYNIFTGHIVYPYTT